jgi:hypothetical protein
MAQNVNAVSGVTDPEATGHTEQALVELIYIKEANDLIGSAMGNLDSALNASQSVLNILQGLQSLHNSISVKTNSTFPFSFSTGHSKLGPDGATGAGLTISQFTSSYNAAASAYFGKGIDPQFVFANASDPAFKTFAGQLNSLKIKLQDEIHVISTLTPASQQGAGSLYQNLKTVLNELPKDPLNFASTEKWALDNQTHSGAANLAGDIQNDLTTAITSAQSLNDTQKENVRRFLFIFQEYYQSASAVLTSINQIIEQMAQKVSGT